MSEHVSTLWCASVHIENSERASVGIVIPYMSVTCKVTCLLPRSLCQSMCQHCGAHLCT